MEWIMTTPIFARSSRFLLTVALLVVLLLAVWLRARWLLAIEHNVDHAYTVSQALNTLDAGRWPLVGQGTSVLFASPPLMGYLFLPLVALARTPLAVYVLVIALNTLAVYLVYRTGARLLGAGAGLLAAALLAVNPWIIEYSRTSWVQCLIVFFTCAIAWLLFPVLTGQTRAPARRLWGAALLLTAFTQTYLLGFALCASVGVLGLLFWRRVTAPQVRGALWRGVAVFALALALYGIGLAAQWGDVQQRVTNFSSAMPSLRIDALTHALRLLTGADYAAVRGVDAPISDAALRQSLSSIAQWPLLALLALGVAAAVRALWQRDDARRSLAVVLLVWWLTPIALMSYVGQNIHPFYQALGLPAGYLLIAWGAGVAWRACGQRPILQRALAVGGVTCYVALAVMGALNSARYYEETAALPGAHGLTALPLRDGIALGSVVRAQLPTGGTAFASVESYIIHSFSGALFPFVQDVRAPRLVQVPPAGGVVIQFQQAGEVLPPHPFSRARTVNTLADGTAIVINTLPPAAELQPTTILNLASEQGLTLWGYDVWRAGDALTVRSYWRVDGIGADVPQRVFVPFVHVVAADGARAQIVDGEGVAGAAWRVGDVYIHTMTFAPPTDAPRPLRLLLGQYDGLNNANLRFLHADAAADPNVVEVGQ
jgi:4-amino-4-deoxy-L-arabinose transferase-like glycosyltransferase